MKRALVTGGSGSIGSAICRMACFNWGPQSHFALCSASPVRHSECIRTNAGSVCNGTPVGPSTPIPPKHNAKCGSGSTSEE